MRPIEMARRLREGNPDLYWQCSTILANLDAEADIEATVRHWLSIDDRPGFDRLTAYIEDVDIRVPAAQLISPATDGHCYGGDPALGLQGLIKAARGDVAATLAIRQTYGLPAFC